MAEKELLWWIVEFGNSATVVQGGKRVYSGKQGLWWIVGPTYELCKPEFNYLMGDVLELGLIKRSDISAPKNGQCSMTLPFGLVETKSAEDALKIAGKAPDGIIVCEVGQLDYYTWLTILGRTSEKRAKLVASGTFEAMAGMWYPRVWNMWQAENPDGGKSFSIPSWCNLTVYPGGREDPEIKRFEGMYPSDMFMERFGAVPSPPSTLVMREFDPRIHVVPIVPKGHEVDFIEDNGKLVQINVPHTSETYLAVDPGYAGAYAVLACKMIDENIYVMDEVYEKGKGVREVIELCKKRWWWNPEKLVGGVIDVAGRQHPGAESQVEIWGHEAKIHLQSTPVGIMDGIERYRSFLKVGPSGRPRIYFSPRCKNTIEEHQLYKYNRPKEDRDSRELPRDEFNHGIRAITYLEFNYFGPCEVPKRDGLLLSSPFSDWTALPQIDQLWLPAALRI